MKDEAQKTPGKLNSALNPAIRSKYNFRYWKSDRAAEIFIKPSLAVPDQTLKIQTIFERHRRGMMIPEIPTFYESDVQFNAEIYNLDKQDRIELLKKVTYDIEDARNRMYEHQAKIDQEKAEAEVAAHAKILADLEAREKAVQDKERSTR